jgi:ribonucleoside-diphosphate reductase alpha chain
MSLFCPNKVPEMADVRSAEFEALYERYKREGRASPAQKPW